MLPFLRSDSDVLAAGTRLSPGRSTACSCLLFSHLSNEKENTSRLTFEDRKLVEIARAMENDPEILVVDETSTALSKSGRDLMYQVMEKMKENGKYVIFFSHDIGEVKAVCDYLTVLRDGHLLATVVIQEFSDDGIRKLRGGRDVSETF